ncbi:hypothetical protein JCM10213_008571 [Rhodosporidiobolus nylandii]
MDVPGSLVLSPEEQHDMKPEKTDDNVNPHTRGTSEHMEYGVAAGLEGGPAFFVKDEKERLAYAPASADTTALLAADEDPLDASPWRSTHRGVEADDGFDEAYQNALEAREEKGGKKAESDWAGLP